MIPPLVLSRTRLVQQRYYHPGALTRAVLAFLAKQNPLDFSDPDAEILDTVYLLLPHAPNLHHIYPRNFLANIGGLPEDADIDSLMNICYLRAKTNIRIGDRNPLHYFGEFERIDDFENVLKSHLIPNEFIKREDFKPRDYRDFLYARADLLCQKLKSELPDVDVRIVE